MKLLDSNHHISNRVNQAIKIQILISFLILFCLLILVFKQFEFLYRAVASHPELNLLIIGVFAFGLVMALRSMFLLFDDDRALAWMKEAYSDINSIDVASDAEKSDRLARVLGRAKLFHFPKIIGQVFELAMEELSQSRSFHVSLAQRNAMMSMVNDSIHREKSLVHYITGVMILLGLIGTFIGLMEMVASVGGIVGGLAKAGSGSDEAIKGVIKDLEAPLTGMATGFSASLFGLLGSLILGLIARFGQTAVQTIKHDLEHWLTRISQLEAPNSALSLGQGHTKDHSVAVLANSLVGSFRVVQSILMRSADVMRKLSERQDMQTAAVERLIGSINELSIRQEQSLWQLRRVDAIGDLLSTVHSDLILIEKSIGNRFTMEFGRLADHIDQSDQSHRERYSDVLAQYHALETMARGLELQTQRGFEDISLRSASILADQSRLKQTLIENRELIKQDIRESARDVDAVGLADRLGASVDERLAAGFGAIASSIDKSISKLAESLAYFGDIQNITMKKLDEVTTHPLGDEIRSLGKSVESGLSSGFADLSRILDVLVAALNLAAPGRDDVDVNALHGVVPEDTTAFDRAGLTQRYNPDSVAKIFKTVRKTTID